MSADETKTEEMLETYIFGKIPFENNWSGIGVHKGGAGAQPPVVDFHNDWSIIQASPRSEVLQLGMIAVIQIAIIRLNTKHYFYLFYIATMLANATKQECNF